MLYYRAHVLKSLTKQKRRRKDQVIGMTFRSQCQGQSWLCAQHKCLAPSYPLLPLASNAYCVLGMSYILAIRYVINPSSQLREGFGMPLRSKCQTFTLGVLLQRVCSGFPLAVFFFSSREHVHLEHFQMMFWFLETMVSPVQMALSLLLRSVQASFSRSQPMKPKSEGRRPRLEWGSVLGGKPVPSILWLYHPHHTASSSYPGELFKLMLSYSHFGKKGERDGNVHLLPSRAPTGSRT